MPSIDLLVIDEAHHAVADSYMRIINTVRDNNPKAMIYGVTATPNRGDKKGLKAVFSNVADQIQIAELIATGHLVCPKTYVIDVGIQDDLNKVRKTASDYDMSAVEEIMNKSPINDAVIKHWQEKAGNRKTIIFCSTVEHAKSVAKSFDDHNIKAVVIHGGLSDRERKATLVEYEQGDTNVIINVAVLTEGYDYQPTSCVILLRPSSYKSTMVQMIGRGLRVVDPNLHPDVSKDDCIVLDFGTSILTHGKLEEEVDLQGKKPHETEEEDRQYKKCPECDTELPINSRECPLCGHKFGEEEGRQEISNFIMSEVDLLGRSQFRWCDLFGDDESLLATGFNSFAGLFYLNAKWYAVGQVDSEKQLRLLARGERINCLAVADDFLNAHESDDTAHKSRRWLNEPPTHKQLDLLPTEYKQDFGLNKYHASALIRFNFNKARIKKMLFNEPRRQTL